MKIKTAAFVISNTDYRICPAPKMAEYAFIGRSNVGKSSLINAIVNQKNLAKFLSKKTYNAKEDLDGKKIWMLLNIELWLQEKKF